MKSHEDSKTNRFNTYIRKLREKSKMTAAALADALGIHRNTQLNYELNRDPKIEYLLKLSDKLKVPFNQLIRMRVMHSDCEQPLIDKALNSLGRFGHDGIEEVQPPYGTENGLTKQINNIQFNSPQGGPFIGTLEQIANGYHNQSQLRVFKQQGESMAPKICEDDLIVIDTENNEIVDGHIYYLNMGQQMMARRIQIGPNQQLIISCDNDQFAPITLEHKQRDEMTIIGKMICYIGNNH